jgi:hypothetical protein
LVLPQRNHGVLDLFVTEGLVRIDIGADVSEIFGVDLVALDFKIDVFVLHDVAQDAECNHNVGEDDGFDLYSLIILKSTRMDDSHLLDDCRFARFTGACMLSVGTASCARSNDTHPATGS